MDLQVYQGSEIKAAADGSYRTLLVRFSDPTDVDLYGDYFTRDTFFGKALLEGGKIDVYYDHGFDRLVKRASIGVAALKVDDVGVWMEGQIEISDEHFEKFGGKAKAKKVEDAIRQLAVKGKLGSSSGAVGHLVEYEEVPGHDAHFIKAWPLGEGSMTPRPADTKKRKVETLKSFIETAPSVDLASIVKSAQDEGATEVHVHYHQTQEIPMSEEIKQTEEVVAATKTAPESVNAPDVNGLVAVAVKQALDARDESERQAKAAKEAEEKRVNDEVEKRMEQFAKSRAGSGYSPVAIRTQGITPDGFGARFVNYMRAGKNAYLLSKATQELMELDEVQDGETVKSADGTTYRSDFQIKAEDVSAFRIANGHAGLNTDEYRSLRASRWSGDNGAVKASNATDMNIGTAADGGSTVGTGFYNSIITKRDEVALHTALGCQNIPGKGTTVTVAFDNEADGEFITVGEATQFDQDAPAVSNVDLTLVDYTKRTLISYQLLDDSYVNIMQYIQDRVAIGWAKTINTLLVAEAETCTQYKRGGTVTGYTFGELEDVVYNNTIAPYLSDGNNLAWVGAPVSYGKIIQIVGSDRQYGGAAGFMNAPADGGFGANRQLLQYPFHLSNKVDAIGARGKSLLFGAWNYMLYRESPSLQFLLDPYTRADYAQNRLLWFMRWDFQAGIDAAIGYFEHDLT
ncbi:MAG TPA: phage major capsid protein [Pirellulales bacterium]|nr:phage major capsid protein [Pirellulales bacterium]